MLTYRKQLFYVAVLPLSKAFIDWTLPRLVDFSKHIHENRIDFNLIGDDGLACFDKLERFILCQLMPDIIAQVFKSENISALRICLNDTGINIPP